jgi:hypothetical protein
MRKANELAREDCGTQRKLAAACRKMTFRARVARHRRNVFRKIRTQGNFGTRKELAAVGMKMTGSAGVARCKRHGRKRQNKDDVGKGTQKGRADEKRRWKDPGCKNGIRSRYI